MDKGTRGTIIFGIGVFLTIFFVTLLSGNPEKVKNSRSAQGDFITFGFHECDSGYLGAWEVENFGNVEIFCENGVFFGENDVFSLAMTELGQKGYFNAVFCQNDACFSCPVVIEGDSMRDMPGMYFKAVKNASDS